MRQEIIWNPYAAKTQRRDHLDSSFVSHAVMACWMMVLIGDSSLDCRCSIRMNIGSFIKHLQGTLWVNGVGYEKVDPLVATLSESILVDIVIGGIGVAGVILGLYCSNMTSVYSSKYTNAPVTISSAFQRDVVTNRCIKQITGYIIFCVIILFGRLIGISFSYR